MIVCLDGTPGSGKNTIGKMIAETYSLSFYSMGDLMRSIAKRKNINLIELNRMRDKSGEIDKDIDTYMEELGKEEDNFVITSRTSHHFIPHGIKIFLKTDYEEAVNRIWKDLQESNERNEGTFGTKEDLLRGLIERQEGDRKRYLKYYKIDINDVQSYDFVLETNGLTLEEVYTIVSTYVAQKKNHLISEANAIPDQETIIEEESENTIEDESDDENSEGTEEVAVIEKSADLGKEEATKESEEKRKDKEEKGPKKEQDDTDDEDMPAFDIISNR